MKRLLALFCLFILSLPACAQIGGNSGGIGWAGNGLPLTDAGDLLYLNALLEPTALHIGTVGQVLTVSPLSLPAWEDASGGMGTVTSVGLSQTGLSFIGISGSPVTTSGTLAMTASATKGDILYASAANVFSELGIGSTGQVLTVAGGIPSWAAPATSGTVTSFSAGNLSPLFTTSVATATTTPALSFSLSNAASNTVLANISGSSGAPSYTAASTVVTTGLPLTTQGDLLFENGTPAPARLGAGTSGALLQTGGGGANPAWTTNTYPGTDSKGDILYASAANTIGGLSVGSTGQIITVASGLPAYTTDTYPSTNAQGDIIYASSANTLAGLTVGSNHQVLITNGTVPSWGQVSLTAGVTGVLPIANGGTDNGSLPVTNGGVLYTDGTEVQNTGAGSSGQFLKSVGAGEPVWANAPGTGTVNSGTAGQLTYYASTGTAVSGNPDATISSGALTLGVASTTAGSLVLEGGTSGSCTVSVNAVAGSGTAFVLPVNDGSANQFLQTDGSGNTSWHTAAVGTVTSFSAGNLSSWFNTSVATATTTPALTFSPTGSKGDILYFSAANTAANLGVGSNGQIIIAASGAPTYTTDTYPSTSTKGDVVYASAANTLTGLAIGTTGQVLTVSAGGVPSWAAAGGGGGFGGNGADGAIALSTATAYTAPKQTNATTFTLTGANTLTITGAPMIINATSTWNLGDGSNASTITVAAGSGASGGMASNGTFNGGSGAGPGGGQWGSVGNAAGGGGFGGAGGGGGGTGGNGGATYQSWIQGGSGGGGGEGSPAAGGANGGGSLVVCAVGAVTTLNSSVINCLGGAAPGSSASGGAGGGSGGLVFLSSQTSATLNAVTINVSGTVGGVGGSTYGGGGGGGSGRIVIWSPSNSTGSATFTMNGGTGGTGFANGANGGSGTAQSITGTPNLPLITWTLTTPEGGRYLDTLTNMEIACGRKAPNNVVSLKQADITWGKAKDINEFCMLNMGNMEGTTCLLVGDCVDIGDAA